MSTTSRAFGVVERVDVNKIRVSGWDDERHMIEEVFRVSGFNIQVGIIGPNGGRAWRDLRPGEWAHYPEWLTTDVPKLLGLPAST